MQTYLVGGAVRDALLNIPVKDKDWVVVGTTAEEMLKQGFQQVGADFPVFLHPNSKEEYALARTERKSGHGYTGFSVHFDQNVTLEEDLARRDLTINAMAQSHDGDIIDPFHGLKDLNSRVLRHVSPAFAEDPLRVLRVARFAARLAPLGFTVADETLELMQQMSNSGELNHLVAERVWQEMARALSEPKPSEFFQVLRRSQALKVIFPELDACFGVPQTMRWHPEVDTGIHVLKALDCCRHMTDETAVLHAVLCHDLGKGMTPNSVLPSHHGHEEAGARLIAKLSKRYKWPKKPAQLAEIVARYHTHCHTLSNLRPSTAVKLLKALSAFRQPELMEGFLIACEADYRGRSGFEHHDYPNAALLRRYVDACRGIDVNAMQSQGLTGKALGDAIDAARADRIAAVKSSP